MADPIPLLHNGTIRAWMCGACEQVHAREDAIGTTRHIDDVIPASQWRAGATVREMRERAVEFSRSAAKRCCECRGCGRDLPIPRPIASWTCDRCTYVGQWICAIGEIAKAMALAKVESKPARTPIVPLPPDEAWHQGGDGGRGHPTWQIPAGISELSEDAFCATWMSGAEFTIWNLGNDPSNGVTYGYAHDAHERCCALVSLAKDHGVWWYYQAPIKSADDNDPIEYAPGVDWTPWPVTLETWAKMRAAHRIARAVTRG